MFQNKAFMKRALPILILGVFYMFFYSGLQNDHLNVITPFLSASYGWDATTITNPVTWAGFVVIVFYLVCGWAFVRFGVIRFLVPCTLLLGAATIGLPLSGDNYPLYALCLFLIRLMVTPLQMGTFMLCANWFIKYRGRALGWVTIGSPLFSAIGTTCLTLGVQSVLGFQGCYILLGVVILVLAILTVVTIRDTPEACGLYPDGSDRRPADTGETGFISLRELLSKKEAWLLIISYGILQFILVAVMAFYVVRMQMVGTSQEIYLSALAIGALLGIPMSYLIGWVDDKMGSIRASLVLCLLYLFALVPMYLLQPNSTVMSASVAFGIACMGGGCPTMHPAITAYVYGRKKYQSANKWIMTIQAIIMAFAVYFMSYWAGTGDLTPAYLIMLVMLAVAFVAILGLWKTPDANLSDRAYGAKSK